MQTCYDVTVRRDGGMFSFEALTEAGRAWVDANVDVPDWARTGPVFHLDDGRLAWDLYQGMLGDGLRVGDG